MLLNHSWLAIVRLLAYVLYGQRETDELPLSMFFDNIESVWSIESVCVLCPGITTFLLLLKEENDSL